MEMQVAGITSAREVFIGSRDRNFKMSEYLIVEDVQGDIVGEIVDAQTFNRYLPLGVSQDFVDRSVLESLSSLGYRIDEETVYIGKLRFINETLYPVTTGAKVRVPEFSEVKSLLVQAPPKQGMLFGIIKNTDSLFEKMPEEYKNLAETFEDGETKPQGDVPYIFPHRTLHQYPHIGIFGGSGSGKSFGLRVILEELMKKRIPTVVLDPHYEMDFSSMRNGVESPYLETFIKLQIGRDIGVDFKELQKNDLKNLLSAASPITDAMSGAVDSLFNQKFTLEQFKNLLKQLSEAQACGGEKEITERMETAPSTDAKTAWEIRLGIYKKYAKTCPYQSVNGIFWRLSRLEKDGIFYKDIKPSIDGISEGKLVVIQGSTRMIQVFATYLLDFFYKKRRDYKDGSYLNMAADCFPPFVIATDEAHNFAPKGYDSPAKTVMKEISQEGRKYGVFLIFATQRPTLLDETISAQLNTKLIFRTVRSSDIQTIKEETDLTDDETKRLPYLKTGDVFVSSSSLGRTSYVRIRAADTTAPNSENPFDELSRMAKTSDKNFISNLSEKFPIHENELIDVCKFLEGKDIRISVENLRQKLDALSARGILDTDDFFDKTWRLKEQKGD